MDTFGEVGRERKVNRLSGARSQKTSLIGCSTDDYPDAAYVVAWSMR